MADGLSVWKQQPQLQRHITAFAAGTLNLEVNLGKIIRMDTGNDPGKGHHETGFKSKHAQELL